MASDTPVVSAALAAYVDAVQRFTAHMRRAVSDVRSAQRTDAPAAPPTAEEAAPRVVSALRAALRSPSPSAVGSTATSVRALEADETRMGARWGDARARLLTALGAAAERDGFAEACSVASVVERVRACEVQLLHSATTCVRDLVRLCEGRSAALTLMNEYASRSLRALCCQTLSNDLARMRDEYTSERARALYTRLLVHFTTSAHAHPDDAGGHLGSMLVFVYISRPPPPLPRPRPLCRATTDYYASAGAIA